jgi:phenylacetate-CoA ligase
VSYTALCSRLLFPIHERLKGHSSVALRRELEASQWHDRATIEAAQFARLRAFLAEAARHVPYYRSVFAQAGFAPEALRSRADLEALPRLTKPLIREHLQELVSEQAGKLLRYNTGGSSGEPLVFYMGMDRVSHDVAAKWRATRWWGVDIGDPEAVLWGSPVELGAQDRLKALRDRLFRSHLLPAFQMSVAQMDAYLGSLRRLRPRMIFGYASALALLAGHAAARGVALDALGVRVVFATGETLYPDQRELIERIFGAPVANGYGARDAGFVAHQCPHGQLHESAEHVVVELLGESGAAVRPGEQGEIVVTHLATRDFPFIRYRTGDVAVAATAPCGCGRGLPALERVIGRTTDFVRTADGGAMHALSLIYEVRERPGVRAFKFVQDERYALTLLVVAGPELTADVEAAILAGLRRRVGPRTPVVLQRVEQIPPERSGKYRYVVSRAPAAPPAQ